MRAHCASVLYICMLTLKRKHKKPPFAIKISQVDGNIKVCQTYRLQMQTGGRKLAKNTSFDCSCMFYRLEDVNLALRDLAVKANWTKVAVLYSYDYQGPSALHLQHLLLKKNIDCFARKFRHKNVSKIMQTLERVVVAPIL